MKNELIKRYFDEKLNWSIKWEQLSYYDIKAIGNTFGFAIWNLKQTIKQLLKWKNQI